jgi:hypothetical protein
VRYEKCKEIESMRKSRKGKVRCEKQVVTFASVISVAESWLLATSHSGLSGADFIAGSQGEQVNLSAPDKMETGNPCIGLVQADRGRPDCSSDEVSVMEAKRRVWLVGVLIFWQLNLILG